MRKRHLASIPLLFAFAGCTNTVVVTDPRVAEIHPDYVVIAWTDPVAPAGSGDYEITRELRHTTTPPPTPVSDAWWYRATLVPNTPTPKSNTPQQMRVGPLDMSQVHYFALRINVYDPDKGDDYPGPISKVVPAQYDNVPPAAILDLAAEAGGSHSVDLHWTATGDDGRTGPASAYDLRYRTDREILTDADFNEATPVTGLLPPADPGSPEAFTLPDLGADLEYHFALRVRDENPLNWTALSNPASARTLVESDEGSQSRQCSQSAAGRGDAALLAVALAFLPALRRLFR